MGTISRAAAGYKGSSSRRYFVLVLFPYLCFTAAAGKKGRIIFLSSKTALVKLLLLLRNDLQGDEEGLGYPTLRMATTGFRL